MAAVIGAEHVKMPFTSELYFEGSARAAGHHDSDWLPSTHAKRIDIIIGTESVEADNLFSVSLRIGAHGHALTKTIVLAAGLDPNNSFATPWTFVYQGVIGTDYQVIVTTGGGATIDFDFRLWTVARS